MAVAGYPPADHILAVLGFEADITASGANVRIRVTPHITGADGGVRAGVLATVVDMAGGAVALWVLRPDWQATADLTLQLLRPATGPLIEARSSVLRRGRTTLVIEASVFNLSERGPDELVAWATITFAILPGTGPISTLDMASDPPSGWAFTGPGLDRSVVDALFISGGDIREGRVSMPVGDYLLNSLGAVQGGVMALLTEVAGAAAVGAAIGVDPSSMVVTDLQIAYLALGRVGPIVSRSRVLDGDGGASHRSAVVELIDEGAGDRLTTCANVGARPVDDLAALAATIA